MPYLMTETYARKNDLILDEGKTKIVARDVKSDSNAFIISKDDITAGDGAKHDVIEGKAAFATKTACNVFRLLKACGIPVAFEEQVNDTTFIAPLCTMCPYEVVVRREADGSYLKRMPSIAKGHYFQKLVVEFFLKTSGRKWKHYDLPCDDPFMRYLQGSDEIVLYEPSKPIQGSEPFLVLGGKDVFSYNGEWKNFADMEKLAKRTFLILEKAWQLEGRTLVDFKVEFGFNKKGALLLADVIDNDSWRVLENGEYIDKQVYRDGGSVDDVTEKYRRVAEITGHFRLPVQQIVIWRGSEKDDVSSVVEALDDLCRDGFRIDGCLTLNTTTISLHKEPINGLDELNRLVRDIPDTVVIACIGRSNGAGPILSASTTVPVITVPVGFKEFPEDVWSSLRTPSYVPVVTVLEPSNAAMAAVEILALHNPLLYMSLRERLELERFVNRIRLPIF